MKAKLQSIAETQQANKWRILASPTLFMMGLFFITMLFPKLFSIGSFVLLLIGMGATIIVFGLFNQSMDEVEKKRGVLLIKTSLFFLITYVTTMPLLALGAKIGKASVSSMSIMFFVFGSLIFLAMMLHENTPEKFEKIKEIDLFAGKEQAGEQKPGDVVLCSIAEKLEAGDKNPLEILPFKDRFLHMLILGATGTGKTSQTLIPMIHQDIQNPEVGVIVLEPKGDLAQKIKFMGEHYGRKPLYFDPSMDDCPYFNPLAGREIDVVENMATTFRTLNPDSPTFFLDLSEQLVRNGIKVLKRLDKYNGKGDVFSTLNQFNTLIQGGKRAEEMMNEFAKKTSGGACGKNASEQSENNEISEWFQNSYFGEKSKVFENTSGVRSQVAKICSNEFLRDVLNPDPGKARADGSKNPDGTARMQCNDIDFDKVFADGGVLCITTAQGVLRDLSRFLGYFLILQLQSAVFRRPGNEDTRRANFLYIDEFQTYSTPGFADMLTMGRSYRVASHLATQARAQMAMGGGKDGKDFVTLVSTNARNVILYPGCSHDDADYYSKQFGEYEKTEKQVGISRKKFSLITGGLDPLGHPTESIRETTKKEAIFSPSDLIYRPFGEIVYCIIKNNSIQTPKVGKISYIPADLNKKLDAEIAEYIALHQKKTSEEQQAAESKQEDSMMEFGDGEEDIEFEATETSEPEAQAEKPKEKASAPLDIAFDDDEEEPVLAEGDDDDEEEWEETSPPVTETKEAEEEILFEDDDEEDDTEDF